MKVDISQEEFDALTRYVDYAWESTNLKVRADRNIIKGMVNRLKPTEIPEVVPTYSPQITCDVGIPFTDESHFTRWGACRERRPCSIHSDSPQSVMRIDTNMSQEQIDEMRRNFVEQWFKPRES